MKINWKVRFKNPQFWFMIILAMAAPVSAYFDVAGTDLTTWIAVWDLIVSIVSNPFVVISIFVGIYNALIDPVSKGFTDSRQALNYDKPNEVK